MNSRRGELDVNPPDHSPLLNLNAKISQDTSHKMATQLSIWRASHSKISTQGETLKKH